MISKDGNFSSYNYYSIPIFLHELSGYIVLKPESRIQCKKCDGESSVLNMIRFSDRDPTVFCDSEPDPHWAGFRKYLNRNGYGYPICVDHCSRMLNQSFFGYQPDWIKYLDIATGVKRNF